VTVAPSKADVVPPRFNKKIMGGALVNRIESIVPSGVGRAMTIPGHSNFKPSQLPLFGAAAIIVILVVVWSFVS
jgi:hypothetical protein